MNGSMIFASTILVSLLKIEILPGISGGLPTPNFLDLEDDLKTKQKSRTRQSHLTTILLKGQFLQGILT